MKLFTIVFAVFTSLAEKLIIHSILIRKEIMYKFLYTLIAILVFIYLHAFVKYFKLKHNDNSRSCDVIPVLIIMGIIWPLTLSFITIAYTTYYFYKYYDRFVDKIVCKFINRKDNNG